MKLYRKKEHYYNNKKREKNIKCFIRSTVRLVFVSIKFKCLQLDIKQ